MPLFAICWCAPPPRANHQRDRQRWNTPASRPSSPAFSTNLRRRPGVAFRVRGPGTSAARRRTRSGLRRALAPASSSTPPTTRAGRHQDRRTDFGGGGGLGGGAATAAAPGSNKNCSPILCWSAALRPTSALMSLSTRRRGRIARSRARCSCAWPLTLIGGASFMPN